MKVIKKISVYLLLLIMVFSSIGISFYLHDCNCRKTVLVSIGTGFGNPKEVSCCFSCTPSPEDRSLMSVIDKKGCCSDHVYFYLLPVTTDHVVSYLPSIAVKLLLHEAVIDLDPTDLRPATEIFTQLHPPPLKFSGKELIYFLQQIKIPFPDL